MRCLVTGGAGFIGSHLVEKLVERGDEVTVLDDLSAGKRSNLESVIKKIDHHLGNGWTVSNSYLVHDLAEEIDIIFHLATQCLVRGLDEDGIFLMHQVNDIGTFNICLAAKEHNCKIVYIGTSEEYGPQKKFPIKETAPMNPVSIYGFTKLVAERYVKFFHRIYGVPTVIIRPFNTFGPRQREDAYAGVITNFVKRLEAEKTPIIQGNGLQRRDFTYVTDIVDGILLLSKLQNCEVINLGSGTDVSIIDLANKVAQAWTGYYNVAFFNPGFDPPRPNDIRILRADISLAQSLGYESKVSLKEGLKKYVEWYKSSRNR